MEYVIYIKDLEVIKKMGNEHFPYNGIPKTHELYEKFKDTRSTLHKSLKSAMQYFSDYGNFKYTNGSGNPIPYGTDRIGEVWAACYFGNRKQQSPQIYVHYNTHKNSIDVGFSFGFHTKTNMMRKQGKNLADYLNKNTHAFYSLKKLGFAAYVGNWNETSQICFEEWLKKIQNEPATCRIVKSLHEDVGNEKLQETISSLIFIINGLDHLYLKKVSHSKTKDERIKEYIRNLDVGEKGEKWVLEQEKKKLIQRGFTDKYPIWESQKNDNSGYDIVSLDENGEEIFIEVKTTALTKENSLSSTFYMSANEYDVMKANEGRYYIFRVYNIDGDAEYEIHTSKDFVIDPMNYRVTIGHT